MGSMGSMTHGSDSSSRSVSGSRRHSEGDSECSNGYKIQLVVTVTVNIATIIDTDSL